MKLSPMFAVLGAALLVAPGFAWATTPFDHELVLATGLTGYNSSLALDVDGNPHVSFVEFPASALPVLRYAVKSGGAWTVETIATGGASGFGQTSLKLDPQGEPWITYYDATYQYLLYATKDGTAWQVNYIVDYGADLGSFNSLAIDRQGHPHVAYYDATNGDLKYASYSLGWTTEVVHSGGIVGQYCSLALDAEGSPHISYYDATNGWLRYAYKGGGSWIIDVSDGNILVGRYTSIALDSQNHPHISYFDAFNSIVKYASKFTVWSSENVEFGSARPTALAIDAQDVPHIAYTSGYLRYASRTYGYWDPEVVETVNQGPNFFSLALDAEGNAFISYQDGANSDLLLATSAVRLIAPAGGEHWSAGTQQTVRWSGPGPVDILLSQDGGASYTTARSSVIGGSATVGVPAWTTTSARVKIVRSAPFSSSESPGLIAIAPDLVPLFWSKTVDAVGDVGVYSSLALDAQGNPRVSYNDGTNGHLKFASRMGSSWTSETVDATSNRGTGNSLFLDASGNPHISYSSFSDQHIRYASKSGSTWTVEDVATGTGYVSSLALDAAGNPRISYISSGLAYASKSGGIWTLEAVDATVYVQGFTSLALDAAGNPYIGYYDFTNQDLRFATKSGGIWSIETVDALGDEGGSSSIALDSKGGVHIAYFDYTNWDLKYATRANIGWVIETVDALGIVGQQPSLALDSQDNPHITYHFQTYTDSDIRYASKHGASWVIETVQAGGYLGPNSSLKLDALDIPRVSYYDNSNGDLRYAAETLEISAPTPGVTWPVGSHRSVTWDGTGRVNLSLSVDGGASYAPIAAGLIGGSYQLTVPHTPSHFCKVKLERTVPETVAVTDSFLTIQTSVALLALLAAPAPNRDSGALVTWSTDPGPGDLAGYRLDRASGGGAWATVAALTRETSYADPEAGPGTRYRLYAVNGLGEELLLGETSLMPRVPLAAWPLPYRGGNLSIAFATRSGLGGGLGPAQVSLYDVSGRLVRTVARGEYSAGYQSAIWDGRDDRGRRIAAGIYFLRAAAAGEEHTMKVVVVR